MTPGEAWRTRLIRPAAPLLLAFVLRLAAAGLTEWKPPLPAYHFTDASFLHEQARRVAAAWRGEGDFPPISPASRLYAGSVAALYWGLGERPLWPKAANAAAATAALYAWYRLAAAAAGPGAASAALWLLALWPSAVFYAAQNAKEPHIWLFGTAALCLLGRALQAAFDGAPAPGAREHAAMAGGAGALLLLGLYRPHAMLVAVAVLGACAAALALARRERAAATAALAAFAWTALPVALFRPVSRTLYARVLPSGGGTSANDPTIRVNLMPVSARPERPVEEVSPFSPRGLEEFRRIRQSQDQLWAKRFGKREIETQIFPDAEFRNWLDVALFWPKGTFYALLMPLPGLYPLGGKAARAAAAAENLALLALLGLAAAGFRRRRPGPAGWAMAGFFATHAAAYGLFEYDLGAAARHKLQFVPMLFPFAAAAALALRGRFHA